MGGPRRKMASGWVNNATKPQAFTSQEPKARTETLERPKFKKTNHADFLANQAELPQDGTVSQIQGKVR